MSMIKSEPCMKTAKRWAVKPQRFKTKRDGKETFCGSRRKGVWKETSQTCKMTQVKWDKARCTKQGTKTPPLLTTFGGFPISTPLPGALLLSHFRGTLKVLRKGLCRNPRGIFPNKVPGELCGGFFGGFFRAFFLGKNRGKNPPKNPRQNSNRNLGVSLPKSTLQGSGLEKVGRL